MAEWRFDWRFNWKLTLFCCICLIGFVSLGNWQLSRAVDKTRLLTLAGLRESAVPVAADELPVTGDINGTRVALQGTFHPVHVWLLDNRVLAGQVGYEVLHLFRHTDSGEGSDKDAERWFLVNRGFVAMGRTRAVLPPVPPTTPGPVRLSGRVYQPEPGIWAPADDVNAQRGFPMIVQSANIPLFAAQTDQPIYPYMIRLDEGHADALPRYWPTTAMLPQQHRGYAIQWFTMALAVCLAWLFFSFRRRTGQDVDQAAGVKESRPGKTSSPGKTSPGKTSPGKIGAGH